VPSHLDFLPYKLIAGIMGLALLALAGLQLGASTLQLYAKAGLEHQLPGTPENLAALGEQIKLLQSADDWFGAPDTRILAGLYGLPLAYRVAAGADGRPEPARLKTAIADLSDGLARSPGNPWAWAKLSEARSVSGDLPGAVAALKASMLLGPNEIPITITRAELGLKLWPSLDTDERRAVASQIRLAWENYPNELVTIAKSNDAGFPVMIALARDPVRLGKFMNALASRR